MSRFIFDEEVEVALCPQFSPGAPVLSRGFAVTEDLA